jgi:hypothetical protein
LYDLCRDMLQNSAVERKWIRASTADWSTGRYRIAPKVVNDVTDSQAFRDSRLSRPAEVTKDGIPRVRIGIQPWNDDATVCSPKVRTTLLQDPPLLHLSRSMRLREISSPSCERSQLLVLSVVDTVGKADRHQAQTSQVRCNLGPRGQPSKKYSQRSQPSLGPWRVQHPLCESARRRLPDDLWRWPRRQGTTEDTTEDTT